MEIDGNVAKVKMSKFRPTMDFNKVKQQQYMRLFHFNQRSLFRPNLLWE